MRDEKLEMPDLSKAVLSNSAGSSTTLLLRRLPAKSLSKSPQNFPGRGRSQAGNIRESPRTQGARGSYPRGCKISGKIGMGSRAATARQPGPPLSLKERARLETIFGKDTVQKYYGSRSRVQVQLPQKRDDDEDS